jgi:hypothetical protein
MAWLELEDPPLGSLLWLTAGDLRYSPGCSAHDSSQSTSPLIASISLPVKQRNNNSSVGYSED